jgi:Zn finger protein HypA/HybF involved in hydrogenase expression
MHELGITQGIVDRARAAALKAGAAKVADLYVTVTPAADFTTESIEMYYEMLTGEDPMFAGARLHFAGAPVAAVCLACGDEFVTDAREPLCPRCSSNQVRFDPHAVMVQLTEINVDEGEVAGAPGGVPDGTSQQV